jgi:cytochrome oxidase assembly protein ShyY1
VIACVAADFNGTADAGAAPVGPLDLGDLEYRPVRVTGHFLNDKETSPTRR